jgi:hypothetical protein
MHQDVGMKAEEGTTIKRLMPNEALARELGESGIEAHPVSYGSHPLEGREFYSHLFGMNPRFVTNKGIVKIKGKNFDMVQVLQKH